MRRRKVLEVLPNEAHSILRELEKRFNVQIVTQNVDDLHERAGSNNILHLHGSLFSKCSDRNKNIKKSCFDDIKLKNST